jgi:hypothetical protein
MYPSSAMPAFPLTVMAVVMVAGLAAWLTVALIAARDRK